MKAMLMPGVWAAIGAMLVCERPLFCGCHASLGGLHCHLGPWGHLSLSSCLEQCLLLPQSWSVISVTCGVTKGHTDAWWSRLHPVAILVFENCIITVAMVSSWPGLLLRAMFRSMALLQPGSILISVASDNIEGNAHARDLGHNLWPNWCQRPLLWLGQFKWPVKSHEPGPGCWFHGWFNSSQGMG